MRGAMKPVADDARDLSSRHSTVASRWRPFATARRQGIRNTHPGAGVFEFADRPFQRTAPGRVTHSVAPPSTATGQTPRYGYRAAEENLDDIGEKVLDAIADVAVLQGWL